MKKTVEERLAALEEKQARYDQFEEVEAFLVGKIVEAALQAARVRTLGFYVDDNTNRRVDKGDTYEKVFNSQVADYAERLLRESARIPK